MPKDEPAAIASIEKTTVFEGRVWDVVTDTFDFGGQTLARDYIQHPGAVAVIAFNEKQEILLIRQYRRPVGTFLWELPAGLRDVAGESPELAVRRELAEETGYQAGRVEPLVTFFPSPGGNSEQIHIFWATDLSEIDYEYERTGEEADLRPTWVPLAEALESVMASEMQNSIAMLALLTLARKLGV